MGRNCEHEEWSHRTLRIRLRQIGLRRVRSVSSAQSGCGGVKRSIVTTSESIGFVWFGHCLRLLWRKHVDRDGPVNRIRCMAFVCNRRTETVSMTEGRVFSLLIEPKNFAQSEEQPLLLALGEIFSPRPWRRRSRRERELVSDVVLVGETRERLVRTANYHV